MKVQKKLSPAIVEASKPEAEPYRVWDTTVPQLFLRVQPSGVRSWNVQWARTSSKSLGKWPGVTVESARVKAKALLVETDQHGAPRAVLDAKKPKAYTLGEFVEQEFKPWASANRKWGDGAADRILAVFEEFREKPLAELTPWIIEKWRSKRIKAGISPNTCNRDLATLKSALRRALEWGLIDADPLGAVKQSKVDSSRVRYLSEDEENRLRKALADRDGAARQARARNNAWRKERNQEPLPALGPSDYGDHLSPAVLLSLNTGLRRGELTSLEWADIDFHSHNLTVRAAAAKSGKRRSVPLNDESIAALKQWRKQVGTKGRIFPFRDFKTAWGALLEDAKIADFRWHDLRHHFASRLAQAGVNLNAIRDLMGHADLKMTLRYSHLSPDNLAAAVALLSAPRKPAKSRKARSV
ncbi:integrase [Lysobacter niabensis]|uniref:Integrase n=1 Tax=Agrilutibacter niabensis TaxID=380628 RepID=A0ABU1VNB8_9GAMM|nr:tyrosine-type recombinase/integrase [Lysobacter niabensis]MDR7098984.1 integrase [Lysobacter niabensis]